MSIEQNAAASSVGYYLQQGNTHKILIEQRPLNHKHRGGALRGKIVQFSKASRRRLLHTFARIDVSKVRCTFLTLTFHHEKDAARAKKAYRRFSERIRRKFPKVAYIWRMERQERGDVHFHMVLFNFPYIPQASIQSIWEECTREDKSFVHVKLLRGKKQAFFYISKYCGKLATGEITSLDSLAYLHAGLDGRHWGFHNKHLLPMHAIKLRVFTEIDDLLYMRYWALKEAGVPYKQHHYSNFQWMSFGGGGRSGFARQRLSICSDEMVVKVALKIGWISTKHIDKLS